MKNKIIVAAVLLFNFSFSFAQQIINPDIKSKTSFAIVVDKATFAATEDEIRAYKNSVENDGLATYIIYHDFTNPQQIKDILYKLYQQKEQKLEGAVFVGNIPVPMIREAQNLTSAFKMNEKLKWQNSSVPSDRFYDDFDLKFDYLKQDEDPKRALLHYYKLASDSPHYIQMDIYTARIKPPMASKDDNYNEKIKNYLKKLVIVRQETNSLNQIMFSTGHGYSSNSTISWASELMNLRTTFPDVFKNRNGVRILNYRNSIFLKNDILTELMRDDLDLAYMTGHGTADLQLLNGYPDVSAPEGSMENVSRYIRSKMRSAKNKNLNLDEMKSRFQNNLGLNDKWFKDAFNEVSIDKDSIFNDKLDIQTRDLKNVNARVAYLNSCLTGSFQLNDYLAGYYPFSDGNNVVAFANSVGVLQDLWGTQLLGILQHGARVGHLLKKTAFLETHLLGDPTFHFSSDKAKYLNKIMAQTTSKKEWLKLSKENDADLQAYALTELFMLIPEKEFSKTLVDYFKSSAFESVRTQAYHLLRKYNNEDFQNVLELALQDNHEYIRRKALYDVNDLAQEKFIPQLVDIYFQDQQLARSQYKINWMLQFFDYDKMIDAVEKKDISKIYNGVEIKENILNKIKKEKLRAENKLKLLQSNEISEKELLSEIKSLRLYRYDAMVPTILEVLKNTSHTTDVRLSAAEVLSWFGMSYQRPLIDTELQQILENEKIESVKQQVQKTQKALKDTSKRTF